MNDESVNDIINRIVKHPRDCIVTPLRLWGAWVVSNNWRISQRLPRLTKFAIRVGLIKKETIHQYN